ncbi:hypothetical protein DV738_g1909, partial [Chaetothyriales sp. CBS 135597]
MTLVTPRTEADWEPWRPIFTRLYKEQDQPLPKVMRIMEEEYGVKATTKMYKNKIKDWSLTKYLKAEQAQQIVNEALNSGEPDGDTSTPGSQNETLKRAKKSLKRKRAREKAQFQALSMTAQASPLTQALYEEPESYARDSLVSPLSTGPHNHSISGTAWSAHTKPSQSAQSMPRLSPAAEQFLINLRAWTHDAFMSGQWDSKSSSRHHNGRRASRTWASDLTAGASLFRKGRKDLAWKYWRMAVAGFNNPDLFKTWYYETPIRLLFEMGRLVHEGHDRLVSQLLKYTKEWAEKFLDEDDSRRALYSIFGQLDPKELRGLYDRAAKSLYNGFASRIDKKNPLLYEIRLNRALDLLWYDANADLSEWVPSIEEVDESCGPKNPYSVYFLLLEAYRLVAQEFYDTAEDVSQQVVKRLEAIKGENPTVDPWRVGLAYRRLGRIQQSKQRYDDARISFNKALRYVRSGENRNSGSVQMEICQYQEQMSKELNDHEDAALWRRSIEGLEQKVADQEELDRMRLESDAADSISSSGGGAHGFEPAVMEDHHPSAAVLYNPFMPPPNYDYDGSGDFEVSAAKRGKLDHNHQHHHHHLHHLDHTAQTAALQVQPSHSKSQQQQ